jgi:uncharacterized membrane protein
MKKLRDFFKTALIGGVVIMLPIAILLFVAKWVFGLLTGLIEPFTSLIETESKVQAMLVDLLVLAILIATCFIIGLFTRTRLGAIVFGAFERWLLKAIPGYTLIKETVTQLFGGKRSPFIAVALVQAFESPALMTAFVVARHDNGLVTVFAPTGPNPTTGFIFHLEANRVHQVAVPVEEAMRSIIACGVGSINIIRRYSEATPPESSK